MRVIKIRIVYDTPGWAYHHRAKALQDYAPPDMRVELVPLPQRFSGGEYDVLFDMNYGHAAEVRNRLRTALGSRVLYVTSFNNGWPARREHFLAACANAHAVIINNHEYWLKADQLPGTYHISNGVDRRVFSYDPCQRPRRVLWIGSDYHRKLKNYDSVLLPLAGRLRSDGIECDFRVADPYGKNVMSPSAMAAWYSTGAVYVVASQSEGTPNPALEAASRGCALVTTPVGNMPELIRDGVNGIFVQPTLESVEAGVRAALARRRELVVEMQRDIAAWDWSERAPLFFNLFRALLSGERRTRRPLGSW